MVDERLFCAGVWGGSDTFQIGFGFCLMLVLLLLSCCGRSYLDAPLLSRAVPVSFLVVR